MLAVFVKKGFVNKKIEIGSLIGLIILTILLVVRFDIMALGINYILTFIYYPMLIIVFNTGYMRKIFRFKIIDVCARISFNVYILHYSLFPLSYIAIKVLNLNIDLNSLTSMLYFSIFSIVVGSISYFGIEKPLNKYLKGKFILE